MLLLFVSDQLLKCVLENVLLSPHTILPSFLLSFLLYNIKGKKFSFVQHSGDRQLRLSCFSRAAAHLLLSTHQALPHLQICPTICLCNHSLTQFNQNYLY